MMKSVPQNMQLGEGAFAVVKKATHKMTGKVYALKIVNRASLNSDMESSLKEEISVLRELNNDHIMKLDNGECWGLEISVLCCFANICNICLYRCSLILVLSHQHAVSFCQNTCSLMVCLYIKIEFLLILPTNHLK